MSTKWNWTTTNGKICLCACNQLFNKCTRPHISFVVSMISRYQSDSGMTLWVWVKKVKVLWYLSGTRNYLLSYRRFDHLEVVGYSDVYFVGCLNTKKVTSGYIVLLASGAFLWRSARQTLVTSSIFDAIYMACFEATSHVLLMRSFISGLHVIDTISDSLKMYSDNDVVIRFAQNDKVFSKSKFL